MQDKPKSMQKKLTKDHKLITHTITDYEADESEVITECVRCGAEEWEINKFEMPCEDI